MTRVPLHRRGLGVIAYAVVDDDDAALVTPHRWRLSTHGYAETGNPKYGTLIGLHRLVMGLVPGDGLEVDHENGDRLDNRRANLRVCTHAQNAQNLAPRKDGTGHRGVSFHRVTGRWRAYVKVDGKHHHLGLYDDIEDAARAARRGRSQQMTHSNEDRVVAA